MPSMTKPFKLAISQSSIDKGIQRDCWKCPTAREFSLLFPDKKIMTGVCRTFVTIQPDLDIVYRHPLELQKWIRAFDNGYVSVPPVEVEISEYYFTHDSGEFNSLKDIPDLELDQEVAAAL